MKRIDISTEKYPNTFVMVDDEDFEYFNQWKWYCTSHGYAARHFGRKILYMHRIINKTPKGFLTDHIDRITFNNTRKNLRTGDKSLNSINRKIQPNNTSGYKGISWGKKIKKWETYIFKNNLKIHLGHFANIEDAIIARKKGEKKYHAI